MVVVWGVLFSFHVEVNVSGFPVFGGFDQYGANESGQRVVFRKQRGLVVVRIASGCLYSGNGVRFRSRRPLECSAISQQATANEQPSAAS